MFYTNTPFPLLSLRVQANNVLKCLLFVQYNLVCIRGIWKIKHISLVANEYPFFKSVFIQHSVFTNTDQKTEKKGFISSITVFFNET